MKTCHMILSAASVIPLLSSCASHQQTADNKEWNIKPVYNVRHSTETPESYYQLGRYYQGQNRYEQALAAYRKALAIDGTYSEALNGVGVIYAMQGRHQDAIEQFRLAVKQAPNAAHIQNNLGYALYLSKSYAEAVSALKQAVALNPDNQAAHTNLALALDKAGDRAQAVQVMAEAAKPQLDESASPETQEVQQAQAMTTVPAATATAAAPQEMLALPKDWGVIKQAAPSAEPRQQASTQPKEQKMVVVQAAPKPVSQVESRPQIVIAKTDGHELRKPTEMHKQAASVAKPIQQAAVQPKGQGTVVAQPALKLLPATELHARTSAQASSNASVQQARAAAPAVNPYRIEVSNGNGVTGMAKMVAGFLHKEGDSRARLTNRKPFDVASSQVQYRTGYREQAQSLASALPGQPGIAQANNLRGDISVRVLLGKDVAGKTAYFEQRQDKVRLVRYGSDS